MRLIEKLQERQGNKTQAEFAAELGITQAALSRIYSEDRSIGIKVAKRISKRFPDLAFEVAAFLLADDIPTEHRQIPA